MLSYCTFPTTNILHYKMRIIAMTEELNYNHHDYTMLEKHIMIFH